ncbi:MAG TPA: glycosyl transferase family 1, partial [Ruminococcaceae bacterium]|nr:glycosyl transferase family 1 [Oscillospiraceae bacterium]
MEKLIRVAFLSTYPPRECGIATFTQDLFRELQKNCGLQTGIIAVNDQDYVYGKDVIQEFPQQDRASYTKLADWVNRSAIQVIVIEHEYGIYGGECGEYLLDFAERVQKPFVLTLHTVLPNPSEKQKQILQELCKKSSRIVTMASNSQKILCNIYGADPDKITVIPHGVPVFEVPS